MSIDIRKALNLTQLERVDEAQKLLDEIAEEHPHGGPAAGRARQHHARQQALFARPSTITPAPSPSSTSLKQKHWTYFYSRGHLLRAGEEVDASRG